MRAAKTLPKKWIISYFVKIFIVIISSLLHYQMWANSPGDDEYPRIISKFRKKKKILRLLDYVPYKNNVVKLGIFMS